jgi:hypothetical protein
VALVGVVSNQTGSPDQRSNIRERTLAQDGAALIPRAKAKKKTRLTHASRAFKVEAR